MVDFKAEVICDSISNNGIATRLTTFKLRYPRFIHAEFMTHRVISRNASSSRAIPATKMIMEAKSDELRAAPIFWGKNQKGMKAVEELTGDEKKASQNAWREAAVAAATYAERLTWLGAHKQIVNRILEPYTHINVIATATEWDNFFGLRLHKDAQPEFQHLAKLMWYAYSASIPTLLKPLQWHLPFVDTKIQDDGQQSYQNWITNPTDYIKGSEYIELISAIKVSVARCARISYESFLTGKRSTVEEDVELHNSLVGSQPVHASPAEHQATPDFYSDDWHYEHQHGNFRGWRQYRKMIPNEAKAPIPEEYMV